MAILLQLQEAVVGTNSETVGLIGPGNFAVAQEQPSATCIVDKIIPLVAERVDSAMQMGSAAWVMQVMSGNVIWKLTNNRMSKISIPEGQDVTFWARMTTAERDLLLQADMHAIHINVFDTGAADQAEPIYTEELVVATVMGTALSVSGGWRQDNDGWAFKYELPGDVLGEGGRVYRVEIVFRTKLNGTVPIRGLIHTEPMYTARTELGG